MKDGNFYEQLQLTSPPLSTADFTPDELEKILLQGVKEAENGKVRPAKEFFTTNYSLFLQELPTVYGKYI